MKKAIRHHGTLAAKRQQIVLKALKQGGWCTGLVLTIRAKEYIPNIAEAISALRFNGVKIEKRAVPGKRYCQWRLKR